MDDGTGSAPRNTQDNSGHDQVSSDPVAQAPRHIKPKRIMSRKRKSGSAFRTISEVADLLNVEQHVLRFWETKFTHLKPMKRGGGRRYYRPEDVEFLQVIQNLLHDQGYTIKGVQKLLRKDGKNKVIQDTLVEKEKDDGSATVSDYSEDSYDTKADDATEQDIYAEDTTFTGQVTRLSPQKKQALRNVLEDLKALRKMV